MSVYRPNLFVFGTEFELNGAKRAKEVLLGTFLCLSNHDQNLLNY